MDNRSAIFSNAEAHENKVDVVVIIGPDNPGQNHHQESIKIIIESCTSKQLKFCIMGDGKNPVPLSDFTFLPETNNVILIGHGRLANTPDGKVRHVTAISGDNDRSQELFKYVQAITHAKHFLFTACFAGNMNEEALLEPLFNHHTELITCSDKNQVTNVNIGLQVASLFITQIYRSRNSANVMTELFGDLIKQIPETINYSCQIEKSFRRFTIKREERISIEIADIKKWVKDHINTFNVFLTQQNLVPVRYIPISHDEALAYQKRALYLHLEHADKRAIDHVIANSPAKLRAINATNFFLMCFGMYNSHSFLESCAILNSLITINFKGLIKYFSNDSNFGDQNKHRNDQIEIALLLIANRSDNIALRNHIVTLLSSRQSHSKLLRIAITMGLTEFIEFIINKIKFEDHNISALLDLDAFNLAFASQGMKDDYAIALKAVKKEKMTLHYAGQRAIGRMLVNKDITEEDILQVRYQMTEFTLQGCIRRLNQIPSAETAKQLSAEITNLSVRLNMILQAMPPAATATRKLIEAKEAHKKAQWRLSSSTRTELIPKLQLNVIDLQYKEEAAEETCRMTSTTDSARLFKPKKSAKTISITIDDYENNNALNEFKSNPLAMTISYRCGHN